MQRSFILTIFSLFIVMGMVSALNVSFVSPTPASESAITAPSIVLRAEASSVSDSAYSFFDVNNSLVAWWTMDSVNGSSISDISGNGYSMNMFNNAQRNTTFARFGSSLQFNNDTDYARSASGVPGARLTTRDGFTISLWVNLKQKNMWGEDLVNNNGGGSWNGFILRLNNDSNIQGDSLLLYLGNNTGSTFAESERFPVTTNTWYHLAVTFYRDTAYFYVNGTFISARPFYQNITMVPPADTRVYLGLPSGSIRSPVGKLDDILLFSRPLASDEISSLYTLTGGSERTFSASAHGFSAGAITARAATLAQNGDYAFSSTRTFYANSTAPYIISANYSFENATNRTSLSLWVDRGFGTPLTMSSLNGSAYYRVNNGSWAPINGSTYLPFTASSYSGMYGDSLTGFGNSKTWANPFDALGHSYFWGTSLMHGIPSTSISQIRSNILATVVNGTTIFLQGGTNDITGGWSDQGIINNYSLIFNDARARGLHIYLANIIPRSSLAANTHVATVNTWLYDYYLYNNSDRLILGFSDVYSAFLNTSSGTMLSGLSFDGLHPNEAGARVWAKTVFSQGYRYRYHDGFYTEFVPIAEPGTNVYDLKWVISTPLGHSNEYEWNDVFTLEGPHILCPTDLDDDGTYPGGNPDGIVDANDLLFFFDAFEAGDLDADVDDDGDSTVSTPDGIVDSNDLLFFLDRFESGC